MEINEDILFFITISKVVYFHFNVRKMTSACETA